MKTKDAPSNRWNAEHGYGRNSIRKRKGLLFKKVFSTLALAEAECTRLKNVHNVDVEVYPCKWGNDYKLGENFEEHWHVGKLGVKGGI